MTAPVRILLDGQTFETFDRIEVVRDMEEIAGGVTIEGLDFTRLTEALPGWWRPAASIAGEERGPVAPGQKLEVQFGEEVVLRGWLDEVQTEYSGDQLSFRLIGRDVTGDLVDCAAAPYGPAEYSGLNLLQLCQALCQPFGIKVRDEVNVPQRFPKFGVDVGETALDAISKACAQREVLPISDGVGGLVLTRGGRGVAPVPLVFGNNILSASASFNHVGRFAEYLVKGQSRGGAPSARRPIGRDDAPTVDQALLAQRRPAATSPGGARPAVVMTGRATDQAVRRYRPTVRMAGTQSGGASVQEQADWFMRTCRAKSESMKVRVEGWRAGEEDRLWRPNERVLLHDPLTSIFHELLIAAVVYSYSGEGTVTDLRLAGVDAYDVLRDGDDVDRRQPRRAGGAGGSSNAPTVDEALAGGAAVRSTR